MFLHIYIYIYIYVGSQFVVQTDYALDQRAQDNKFVESGLRNWALANMEKDL